MRSYVYYGNIPDHLGDRELYPPERMEQISRCRNEKAKREKYWAWVLLEKALLDAFGFDIANLKFTKLDNNKWICDKCSFSISHTEGAVAVAVSTSEVGIDIEKRRALRSGLEGKILTDREIIPLQNMSLKEREEYLLIKWCEKEAIFKAHSGEALMPRTIETSKHKTETFTVDISGAEYIIAVFSGDGTDLHKVNL